MAVDCREARASAQSGRLPNAAGGASLPRNMADITSLSEAVAGLVRDGDVGLELSHDPTVPIVVGVYPIRPISRN